MDHLAGRIRLVLDPLGFIQNHEIVFIVGIGNDSFVPGQQFIIGDFDKRLICFPVPSSLLLIPFDISNRYLGSPSLELAQPVGNQRFGANQQHVFDVACSQQHSNRRDRLHRFSQSHFIGQDCVSSREQKSNARVLKTEGLKWKLKRLSSQQRFEGWLKQVKQPVFELDHIRWRGDPRPSFRLLFCCFRLVKIVTVLSLIGKRIQKRSRLF